MVRNAWAEVGSNPEFVEDLLLVSKTKFYFQRSVKNVLIVNG